MYFINSHSVSGLLVAGSVLPPPIIFQNYLLQALWQDIAAD